MLTDENDPELKEFKKQYRPKLEISDISRLVSRNWLSPTGGLVTPLSEMNNFAITIKGRRSDTQWYVLVEEDKYIISGSQLISTSDISLGARKIYKFPFELTSNDKVVINSLLLKLDILYSESNDIYNHEKLVSISEFDRIFNVIYNKVVEARMQGRGRSPRRAERRSPSPGAERRPARRSRSPRGAKNILAQMNKETNQGVIDKLQDKYTNAVARGLLGGYKKLKKNYTKKHNQHGENSST